MNLLSLDIETAPNIAYVWGLFNEHIPISRLKESAYVLSWAAKWYGSDEVYFSSIQEKSPKRMLKQIHELLDKADAVLHYNGKRFDIPVLNREFIRHGYRPPAPYKQIDLLQVARNKFKFSSNKLRYVAEFLGVEHKIEPTGFKLWVDCMNRDPVAWKEMKAYNIQDVKVLEQVYEKMLPWINKHPNRGIYTDEPVCTNCGSHHYQRRGFAYTALNKYARFKCNDCGSWFRSNSIKSDNNKLVGISV